MKIKLLCALLALPFSAHSQTIEIDSLRRLLPLIPDDSARVERHIDLAIAFYRTNLDSSYRHAASAMTLAKKMENRRLVAAIHNTIGTCHYYAGRHTEAMKEYMQSLEMRRLLRDERGIALVLGNIAILQMETGMLKEALQTNQELLMLAEKQGDSLEIGRCYVHLGSICYETKDFDNALKHMFAALAIFQKIGSSFGESLIQTNIGTVFQETGDFEKARYHLYKALEIKLKEKDWEGTAVAYSTLGDVAMKEKKHSDAVRCYEQALRHAQMAKADIHIPQMLKSLADASFLANDPNNAYRYLQQYVVMNDSLSKATYSRDMADMQTKHETEKKEAEIRDLENQNRIRNILNYTALGGILALLVVLWLSRRAYRQRRLLQQEKIERLESERKVVALNAHLEGQQRERLRIAEDLHDDFGSGLSKISLLSEVAKKKVTAAELDKIAAAAKELLLKMSEIVWALNHHNDTLPSLATYIRRYAVSFFEDSDLRCHFNIPDLPGAPLSGETRRNVFLVVKESLHNILKHAQASKVEIDFSLKNNDLEIKIRDDGRGLDEAALAKAGNGLLNMEKRMTAAGGHFDIESKPGKGTTVHLSLPLETKEAAMAKAA